MSGTRHLHVTRAARRRYRLPEAAFGLSGRVGELDLADAAAWAARITAGRRGSELPAVTPGTVAGAVALHEAAHALIARLAVTATGEPALTVAARAWHEAEPGAPGAFWARFDAVFGAAAGVPDVGAPEAAASDAGARTGEGAGPVLEEAWLVARARRNAALRALHELFEHDEAAGGAWETARGVAERALAAVRLTPEARADGAGGRPPDGADEGTLLWLLTLPERLEPTSLVGQLKLAAEAWRPYLAGAGDVTLLLRAADLLREEAKGGGGSPGKPGPPPPPRPLVLVGAGRGPANFTPDRSWMPNVALVAKSTYVWLAQLSARYGRRVRRLDEVPSEALTELREDGFNALWLIGVWERSRASLALKRARGQPDAGASAYSLHDYEVAADLGGRPALDDLARRAGAVGLRLASDMVPNHTGLDSRWVVEHPDWFLQLPEPPFEGYTFTGPNLASDPRVEVRVEDGYYDGSDAAVVFERVDAATGEKRYLYHGNDGTLMPWNDTAQLDYLREDVRAAVKATIEHVARSFPIIRFDAAMTLARRHVQRLWHPLPGEGGAVPSRTRFGVDADEFERRMPREFWRELVDEMTRVAPDTLLLAEAFWLMEGYFVRELGMHRVYNSAFMHMLMREDNAGYRRLLKTLLAFDPRVLQRFVNFMSNPDEESAREQFGAGDKYFAVATLLATLPGLPMFGHGQVEGLSEKYGMEYLTPRLDEAPDEAAVRRHRREVAPLLAERAAFAGAESFRLFDLLGAGGVEEAAYVYTNRPGPRGGATASLVAVNNSPHPVAGVVRMSAPFADPLRGGELRSEPVWEALGLRGGADGAARLTRAVGAEGHRLLSASEVSAAGLRLELGPYEGQVWTVTKETAGPALPPSAAPAPVEGTVVAAGAARGRGYDPRLAGDRGASRRRAARRRRR